jgi:hypothetical protein
LTSCADSTITLYVSSFTFMYARTVSHLFLVHLIQGPKFIGLVVTFTFNYDTREYFYMLIQSVQLKIEPRLTASLTDLFPHITRVYNLPHVRLGVRKNLIHLSDMLDFEGTEHGAILSKFCYIFHTICYLRVQNDSIGRNSNLENPHRP